MRALLIAATMTVGLVSAARAEVVDAQANGFEVRQTVHIESPPARVYEALTRIGHWWNSEHTYSRDASHLTLEAVAGGCLCEVLPGGGSAAHMRVVLAQPGRALRLEGALGPLQGMGATGHLTWALTPRDGGTDLVQTYVVGGYAKAGLGAMAAPVDEVLGDQAARLKRWIETGKP